MPNPILSSGPAARPGPLQGIRVLDLSRLLPGPVCSLHLADFGAEVIKVEDPGEGDYARKLGVAPGQTSTYFRAINRGKRSICLDLKTPAGRDAFLRLASQAAVVLESFRPGVVDRLGVGYADVASRNPAVVYCSLTGWGQTGPNREVAGHDLNYLALAGVLDQIGEAGRPPALSNLQIADLLGGALTAAMGILAALVQARSTGQGRHIDVAMADAAFAHQYFALHALATYGRVPPRGSDLLTGAVPCYRVYPTADGRYLAVGALEPKFWRALCTAIDQTELLPAQFATGAAGHAAQTALTEVFASRTQAQWVEALRGIDCCVTPVLTLEEALRDEQFLSRGMVLGNDPENLQFGPALRFSESAPLQPGPAPAQGEHTREVLQEAGFSAAEIAALAGE